LVPYNGFFSGNDKAFHEHVTQLIREKSHLLFSRLGAMPEWEQFLEEAVYGRFDRARIENAMVML
jgi:hypothetical protein